MTERFPAGHRPARFLLPCLAGCLLGLSAQAQDAILSVGHVDVAIGYIGHDAPASDGDADIADSPFVGLAGAYNFAVSSNAAIQVEAGGLSMTTDSDADTDAPNQLLLGGIHANYRMPGSYTIGAFAGFGDIGFNNPGNAEDGTTYGIEGAYFTGDLAVFGQIGAYDGSGNDSESMDKAAYGRAVLAYFLGDNASISGDLTLGSGDAPNATQMDFGAIDIRYNRQIQSRPIEWFVGYQHGNYRTNDGGDKEKLTSNTLYAGLRLILNNRGTVRSRTVNGAMPTVSAVPYFAAGYSVDVTD